jgi:hypothetical protein
MVGMFIRWSPTILCYVFVYQKYTKETRYPNISIYMGIDYLLLICFWWRCFSMHSLRKFLSETWNNYCFWHNRAKKGIKKFALIKIFIVFLKCSSLWVIDGLLKKIAILFLKVAQIPKFGIFQRYIEFLFFIQVLMCFLLLNAFGSTFVLTNFLYQHIFLLKSYFNGLQLKIRPYIKMNLIIFLKI